MNRYFRLVRFAILWLILFLIGRLILGATDVPYEDGTSVFSMVTFSYLASLFFGAFSRSAWGFRWSQGMLVGAAIGLAGQALILLATIASYLVGADTYFNHPTALNVPEAIPLGEALVARLIGLAVNTIVCSIVALIGWSMGKLVPSKP